MLAKKLWLFPLLFGLLGSFLGLILRYAYTGNLISFPFKYFLHAHSHVMLLGFLFNALLALIWINFTPAIDKVSYRYYIALQVCMTLMAVTFLLQGYAFYSILFSTLHLWISYILLIRLWKRLEGNKTLLLLIKFGIIFHFVSSLGPYSLGPLMVFELKNSPWYQQAVFFYLHFQFFGIFFTWLLALLVKKAKINISQKWVISIVFSLILLYAHSLDYNFNNWLIYFFGGLGSLILFYNLIVFWPQFIEQNKPIRYLYFIILIVAITNIIGSFPYMASLVVDNHFILIAWLHFLFLGLFVPFIWVFINKKIYSILWICYGLTVFLSELFLVFSKYFSNKISISIMDLLFYVYLGIFLCIGMIHAILLRRLWSNKQLNIN